MKTSNSFTKAALPVAILALVLGSVMPALAAPAAVDVPLKRMLQGTESPVINFPYMSIDGSGTGRFADAAGSFMLTRQVNRLTGAVQGTFVGTVSVP